MPLIIDFTVNSRLFNNINEKRVKGVFFDCTKHKNVKMVIVRLGQSLCLFKIIIDMGVDFSLFCHLRSCFIFEFVDCRILYYSLNWLLGY